MAARKQGTVKWFNPDKGFGFITQETGEDLFVHYSEISAGGFRSLEAGMNVEFEVTQGKKGKQAAKVNVVEKTVDETAASEGLGEPESRPTPDPLPPNSL